MEFSQPTIDAAWNRSGGRCECTRIGHGHTEQCNCELWKVAQGKEIAVGWEAHHKSAGGPDTVSNCEILCQPCHKQTPSYGD